jgi:hypothetical protein
MTLNPTDPVSTRIPSTVWQLGGEEPGTQIATLVYALSTTPTGPPFTLIATTFGPAPEGNTVISTLAVALGLATDVAFTVAGELPVTLLGAT